MRIAGHLLRQVGSVRVEQAAEVRLLRSDPLEHARADVVDEDVPRPTSVDCGPRVGRSTMWIREREQRPDVAPRQTVHSLWT